MAELTFHPADGYSSETLSALFTRVYIDYPVPIRVDAAGLESMITLYDIDLRASRIGVLKKEPVALVLLGMRGTRGWIGGLGVAPEHRGERVGLAAVRAALRSARQIGLRSIDLEVLTQNLPAIRIYETLGFRRQRTLDIWQRESDATFPLPPHHDVKPLNVSACLARFDDLHAVTPPWQRDLPVLQRSAGALHALGITEEGYITAYVLYRMNDARVDMLDAAAAPGQRGKAIESVLRALIRDRAGSLIRFTNVPQDDPASDAMHHVGAQVELQQYEMTLDL
ncbi:MAG TPA: GNAT family N-acetyltransferase [Anaerolineae bacterium]